MNIKQYGKQGIKALAILAVLAMFGAVRPAQAVLIDFNSHQSTPTIFGVPPSGAVVTDDYESSGIVFGMAGYSAGVAVVSNFGLGSSPVACGLDANGNIPSRCGGNSSGDIYFNFVDPAGSGAKTTTDFLAFKIGTKPSVLLKNWDLHIYDIDDNLLESRSVSTNAFTTEVFNLAGIHRVYIDHTTAGPFSAFTGYALDDITFDTPTIPDTPPSAVPEPSTMLLLGSGLIGLLGYGWRNRRQAT